MRKSLFMILSSIILIVGGQAAFSGGHSVTLDDVKARGNLLCGVSTGAPGFATIDDSGKDIRLEVDGGINKDTIGLASKAGADTFVAGSAIFNTENYEQTISELRSKIV